MAIIALVVSVVLTAALAAGGYVFYKRLLGRVISLESFQPEKYFAHLPSDAAVAPAGTIDVVGAWAMEQERMGRPVDEAEIQMQRRMWAEEGA